jgi:hypothetical protein
MRFTEFGYVDIVVESKRLLRQTVRGKSPTLAEDITQNKEYVLSFVETASADSVLDYHLITNNYYFPITMSFDYHAKAMVISKVIKEARFIRIEGSRLVFEYDNGTRDLRFPADKYESEDIFKFVYDDETGFNYMNTIFVLKFKNQGWDITEYEFGLDGIPQLCILNDNF